MDRKLLEYFLFKKVLDNYISNNIYSLYIKKELRQWGVNKYIVLTNYWRLKWKKKVMII
jgi:hypothetical protein